MAHESPLPPPPREGACERQGCPLDGTIPVRRKDHPAMIIRLCEHHAEPIVQGEWRSWEVAPRDLFEVGR